MGHNSLRFSDSNTKQNQQVCYYCGPQLRNLLQNALQYTPYGGRVRIVTDTEAGRVKLTVRNTGEGIVDNDLPYIFERFYRGEKSRSREHGGAGIGLTIVKELIEAHGGQVGAETTLAETRIWLTLPL